jgi:hypothetical protein
MMVEIQVDLELADVTGGTAKKKIKVALVERGDGSDGVVIDDGEKRQRLVVEHEDGKLVCHVWATQESCDVDPTHRIVLEGA